MTRRCLICAGINPCKDHSAQDQAQELARNDQAIAALRGEPPALTLGQITAVSVSRANRWHPGGLADWSTMEWAAAMCGEAGEAANVAKKLKRLDDAIVGNTCNNRPELEAALGAECADVLLYLVLLAARERIDLQAAVVAKFNLVSEREGFPERLEAPR